MKTNNIADENFRKLAEMFPNAVTETTGENGEVIRAIDKDILMQEINSAVVEGGEERYQFTWPGKKMCIVKANEPTTATLRPFREESVDFGTTGNLYIEGDNLEVLKILRASYKNKIKLIYIDPPYNTGKDFVYKDDFSMSNEHWTAISGQRQIAKDKNFADINQDASLSPLDSKPRISESNDSDGRFHTDWLNMIYPRLLLARDFLTDDGAIFISIDETEVENLKRICSEIFGANNFINTFMWLHGKGKKDSWSRTLQQYVLAFAKDKSKLPNWTDRVFTNYTFSNPDNDPKGKWFSGSLSFSEERSNPKHPNYFTIESPSGIKWTRQWQKTREEIDELIANGDIFFGTPPNYDSVPREKIRPSVIEVIPDNILRDCGETRSAMKELEKLMGADVFDYPKPHQLISKLIDITGISDGFVMDFFAGSSTTAHSVFECNASKNLKFILLQLPENLDDALKKADSSTKTKIKNAIALCDELGRPHLLTEIGKERIRRAGKLISGKSKVSDGSKQIDVGFRVLKLDTAESDI